MSFNLMPITQIMSLHTQYSSIDWTCQSLGAEFVNSLSKLNSNISLSQSILHELSAKINDRLTKLEKKDENKYNTKLKVPSQIVSPLSPPTAKGHWESLSPVQCFKCYNFGHVAFFVLQNEWKKKLEFKILWA